MAIMHTEPRRIKKIKGNKLKFTWNTNPARSKRHFSKRSCSSTAISAHTFLHSCTKAGKKKSQTIARTSQPHVPTNPHLGSLPSDVNRHGRNSRSSPAAYRYTLEGSHPCSDPRITAGITASRRSQDLATSSGPPRDRRPPSGGGSPQAASSGASKRGGSGERRECNFPATRRVRVGVVRLRPPRRRVTRRRRRRFESGRGRVGSRNKRVSGVGVLVKCGGFK